MRNCERRFKQDRHALTHREIQQRLAHGLRVCAEDFERHLFLDEPGRHWHYTRDDVDAQGAAKAKGAWRHFFARHPELRTRSVLAQAYDAQQGRGR